MGRRLGRWHERKKRVFGGSNLGLARLHGGVMGV